jgi:hypothetical protein
MPAFTFEKISPPARRAPVESADTTVVVIRRQRGVIVQMLDRFVEARIRRTLRREKNTISKPRD